MLINVGWLFWTNLHYTPSSAPSYITFRKAFFQLYPTPFSNTSWLFMLVHVVLLLLLGSRVWHFDDVGFEKQPVVVHLLTNNQEWLETRETTSGSSQRYLAWCSCVTSYASVTPTCHLKKCTVIDWFSAKNCTKHCWLVLSLLLYWIPVWKGFQNKFSI